MSLRAIDASVISGLWLLRHTWKRSYNFKGASTSNKVSQEDENSYVTYTLGTSTSKTAKYVLTDSDGTITFEPDGIGDGQIINRI
jgi:hypothetical protein